MFLSDRLFFTQFWLPILVTAGVLALLKAFLPRNAAFVVLAGCAGLGLGYLLARVAEGRLYYPVSTQARMLPLQESLSLTGQILKDLTVFFTNKAPLLLLPMPLLAFAVRDVFRLLRRRDSEKPARSFFALLVVLCLAATIIAPAVSALWINILTIRYTLPVLLLPWFLLTLCIPPRWKLTGPILWTAAGVVLMTATAMNGEIWDLRPTFEIPYPDEVRCLDNMASEVNLRAGLSGYWPAKRITMLSRRGLTVNQIDAGLAPYHLSNNRWWYRGPKVRDAVEFPRYSFAVVDDLDRELVRSRFGPPAAERRCDPYTIWVYNRPSDVAFRNFLREAAVRDTEGQPGLDIREARRIADSSDGIRFEFHRVQRVSTVEIMAAAEDAFDVSLFQGGRIVATVSLGPGIRYGEIAGAPLADGALVKARRAGHQLRRLRVYE
jgi:hypothetical protein